MIDSSGWLVEHSYQRDLTTAGPFPNNFHKDPGWILGQSGNLSSIFIYSLWNQNLLEGWIIFIVWTI